MNMDNDLIRRGAVEAALRNNVLIDMTPRLEEAIAKIPIAYDIDDVVERLKKETEGLTSWAEDMAYRLALDKAIEIVKEGWSIEMTQEHPTVYVPEQEKIIRKVLAERERQDAKWGEQNHTAPVWGIIIGEEYGEMCKAINEFGFNPTPETEEQIYTEAIHTMASCMAMIECIERQRKCKRRGGINE